MAGVTVKDMGLHFVGICMKYYWGGCLFFVLFCAGIFWNVLSLAGGRFGKKEACTKAGRQPAVVLISMTIVLFLTVYNPFLVKYVIPALHFENEYYRFFWILPVIPGTAYYAVRLVFALRTGWGKALAALAAAAVLAFLGTPLEGVVKNFQMVENIYKVPDDLMDACRIIHEDGDQEHPRVVFDISLNTVARQYDPSLGLVLGRDAVLYRDGSAVVTVDPESLVYRRQKVIMDKVFYGEKVGWKRFRRILKKTRTDYLVLKKDAGLSPYLKRAGCRKAGEAGKYIVYRFEQK